jgi:ABC-type sugar transport system permease subunit
VVALSQEAPFAFADQDNRSANLDVVEMKPKSTQMIDLRHPPAKEVVSPRWRWKWRARDLQVWAFILPPLLLYLVFFLVPLIQSIYISFTDWNGIRPTVNWIGLENYQRMLHDSLVWKALAHNGIWVVVGTISPIVISLALAMLLWPRTRGQRVFQAAYFMPQILSTVTIALIWSRVYHPLIGVLNFLLKRIGLGHLATGWLGESEWALAAVLIAAIWAYFGFALVVILAGLQSIDMDLIDAASIDGASGWQRFIYVILPQLRPVLTMIIGYTLIGGFNVFDIVWVMTGGGPANATEVISTLLYTKAFVEDQVSYGTSLAMVLTVISLIVSVLFITLRERRDR